MAVIYQKGLSTHTRGWADLDLDFTAHPVTKDIVRKTNVEAVKRSVRNLIQTNKYDKKFHPEIDGGVTRHLFGLASAATKHDIAEAISTCLRNYEPRVIVDRINVLSNEDTKFRNSQGGINVTGNIDRNGFNVSIFFRIVNSPEPVEVSLFLERIR
jgi:phage baseplate assembly protein W